METCLVDSSTWISYFSKTDANNLEAEEFMNEIIKRKFKIILPMIVYVEVINALRKLKFSRKQLRDVERKFENRELIQYIIPESDFWVKVVKKYAPFTCLKALDLIIFSFALEYEVEEFYTFDKQLMKNYENFRKEKSK